MRCPGHAAYAARRVERPVGADFGQVGADLEEVGPLGGEAQEMREVAFGPSGRIGPRQPERQVEAERHRAAAGGRAQPSEEVRDLANRRGRGKAPIRPGAKRDGNPTLTGVGAPVRMRREGR